MMNPELLHQALQSEDFVLKTQRQLIKDFASANVLFPDNFNSQPYEVNQLIIEISERLKSIERSSASALSQLLYRIDIPESALPDLMHSDDFHTNLAQLVLRREAYKVFLRSKFSS